jgi:hypothetical protein
MVTAMSPQVAFAFFAGTVVAVAAIFGGDVVAQVMAWRAAR